MADTQLELDKGKEAYKSYTQAAEFRKALAMDSTSDDEYVISIRSGLPHADDVLRAIRLDAELVF